MPTTRLLALAICIAALSAVGCIGTIEGSTPEEKASPPPPSSISARDAGGRDETAATPIDEPSEGPDPGDAGAPDAAPTPAPKADAAPPPAPDAAPVVAPKYVTHYVTFYGWPDNTPAGAAISLPSIHTKAGGVGSYADPITFATDVGEWPAGTLLYLPFAEKYAVMEDTCTACSSDWKVGKRHIDVWMNSDSTNTTKLLGCENVWTRSAIDVEVNPPAGRKVSTAPLFDTATGTCRTTP